MPDAFTMLLIAFGVLLALQHSVIWLVSIDRHEIERHTSYRMPPNGKIIPPDYEI